MCEKEAESVAFQQLEAEEEMRSGSRRESVREMSRPPRFLRPSRAHSCTAAPPLPQTQAHAHLRSSTPAAANTAARQHHAHLHPTTTTHSCAHGTATALWCSCCQLTACGRTPLSPCRFTGGSCTRADSRNAPSKLTAASGCARPVEYKAVCGAWRTATVAREIFKDTFYTRHGVNVPATGSPLVIDMDFKVGLCSILVLEVNPQAVVLAAEPILRLCALVKENTARYRQRVRVAQVGASAASVAGAQFLADPRVEGRPSLHVAVGDGPRQRRLGQLACATDPDPGLVARDTCSAVDCQTPAYAGAGTAPYHFPRVSVAEEARAVRLRVFRRSPRAINVPQGRRCDVSPRYRRVNRSGQGGRRGVRVGRSAGHCRFGVAAHRAAGRRRARH
ncbi:hypothetical protein LDHU3_04.1430:CDS1 [Leishmania donovani]|nr:hypothetical protein LDHU3_04.1430:CDS1 [Leishmania donovani]